MFGFKTMNLSFFGNKFCFYCFLIPNMANVQTNRERTYLEMTADLLFLYIYVNELT